MTHQVLDDADWDILFHQSGGEGVPKLVEAENEAILVEVENRIWYNLLKDYGYAIVLFV